MPIKTRPPKLTRRPVKKSVTVPSPSELLAMPRELQDIILEAQAEIAAEEYRRHPQLLEFTTSLGGDDFADY